MIRVLIVDDERNARDSLIRLIERNKDFEIVGEASHGEEALQKIHNALIDVIFLDVEMPGLSGLEVASRLTQIERPPFVVFTTAYNQYAIEAFEKNAVDYVLKPYEPDRLEKTFARIHKELALKQPIREKLIALEEYLVGTGKIKKLVGHRPRNKTRVIFDPKEVRYFQMQNEEVHAYLDHDELIMRTTLQDIFKSLDAAQFVQTHKGYIVNVDRISSVEPMFSGNFAILLKGPTSIKIPLSRNYVQDLKKLFGGW